MNPQALAVLWAQYRTLRNFYPRGGRGGLIFTIAIGVLWYGLWMVAAVAIGMLLAESRDRQLVYRFLAPGLMLSFLYWQIIPILMVSAGASLEMRRLRVYPIPHSQLFALEVLLRVTTAVEMLLMVGGAWTGVLLNPALPRWCAVAFLPFVLFNLFVATGVRDLITRMLAWRRFREIAVFLLVMFAALPQFVLSRGLQDKVKLNLEGIPALVWPWSATARLITGDWAWQNWAALVGWLAIGYAFGRWQFERGLRFDEEAARAIGEPAKGAPRTERLFRFPGRLLPDPVGALVEKEVRSLIRSPRFRLVFLMGFSFGLLIWLPMTFGRRSGGVMQSHFLVLVFAYSLMLMSEVSIWNVLGFDRGAAQLYWLTPVRTVHVLVAKNIAAAIFCTLEMLIITAVCLLFRVPVTLATFVESLLVCFILLVFLTAAGNLSSLCYPRPVDPNQNWKRSSATRFQAMLLILYPIMALPFAFAYVARYAWEAEWAFYAVLAVTAALAAIVYGLCLESALRVAAGRKEQILAALGQGSGPISA